MTQRYIEDLAGKEEGKLLVVDEKGQKNTKIVKERVTWGFKEGGICEVFYELIKSIILN